MKDRMKEEKKNTKIRVSRETGPWTAGLDGSARKSSAETNSPGKVQKTPIVFIRA